MVSCRPFAVTLAVALSGAALLLVIPLSETSAAVERQSIGRSLEKLKKEKKLKIAYFGGSITAGVGASDPSKTSWRARNTNWFRARFPEAVVTEVNAAADGGSEYGAFRCKKALVEQDPDLLFVEFAVDDAGRDEQRVLRSLEGVVRQFWTSNPWAEIVFVYAATKETAPDYAAGRVPRAVGYHQAVARHYGIPEIDVGRSLVEAIRKGEGTWESLTTDGVHPNDAGSQAYRQTIEAYLAAHENDRAAEPVLTFPDSLTSDPFSGAHLQAGVKLYAPGWQKVETVEAKMAQDADRHHIAADASGTELVHKFSGSTVGLIWLAATDGGDIEWSIDDGPPQRLSSWDKAAPPPGRLRCVILADDLSSQGEHTLTVRVHYEKAPQSRGTWIRIAAILMHCQC